MGLMLSPVGTRYDSYCCPYRILARSSARTNGLLRSRDNVPFEVASLDFANYGGIPHCSIRNILPHRRNARLCRVAQTHLGEYRSLMSARIAEGLLLRRVECRSEL